MSCIDNTFRTTLPLPDPGKGSDFMLAPDKPLLLIGSCFTDNIGGKLTESGVPATVNPAGVQYNPASIAAVLRAAMAGEVPEQSIFRYEGRTRSWLFPTRISDTDSLKAKTVFAERIAEVRQALQHADTLIFTFGTAWIYEHLSSDISAFKSVVSNCHKVPAREFARRRLSVEEIAADWSHLIAEIHTFRGADMPLRIIFTVSPIRHFKDGAHENTLSKATLHLAISEVQNAVTTYADEVTVNYFPAWELLMDDLRDYRFYADDMIHPSPAAIEYIWQYFRTRYFSPSDCATLEAAARQSRRTQHRTLLSLG